MNLAVFCVFITLSTLDYSETYSTNAEGRTL